VLRYRGTNLSEELYHRRSLAPRTEVFTCQLNHAPFLNLLPYSQEPLSRWHSPSQHLIPTSLRPILILSSFSHHQRFALFCTFLATLLSTVYISSLLMRAACQPTLVIISGVLCKVIDLLRLYSRGGHLHELRQPLFSKKLRQAPNVNKIKHVCLI